MSSLLQDLVSYAGMLNVYEKGNDVLEKFSGIEISTMQVNKVTDFYGNICAEEDELLQSTLPAAQPDEIVYIESDGSMLFTRDDGWKEVKVGRMFKESDCIQPNGKPAYIRHSQYYSHLGDSQTFSTAMDTLIDNYQLKPEQKIFISDGAPWIKNWIEDSFPQSISILDYYHAVQHLYEFAEVAFANNKEAFNSWTKQQKDLLLESRLERVLQNIGALTNNSTKAAAQKLINYYQSNKTRMDYKKYRTLAAGIIGSGAIESAHRTLIQNRMKLSGQKWSKTGAQNMLNLRAVFLNEKWKNIVQFTQKNVKKAA